MLAFDAKHNKNSALAPLKISQPCQTMEGKVNMGLCGHRR